MDSKIIISGQVIEGAKRGKDLGFPTANVLFTQHLEDGIYVSKTTIDDQTYPSVTFIGAAVTFEETQRKSETYILDFDKNLYGQKITVKLLQKIRNNQKFESAEKLVQQMNDDIVKTREYFKTSTS